MTAAPATVGVQPSLTSATLAAHRKRQQSRSAARAHRALSTRAIFNMKMEHRDPVPACHSERRFCAWRARAKDLEEKACEEGDSNPHGC